MFALSADEEIRTIHTAMRFAGRFYASLATAGTHADPDNRRRLLAAFPELQKTYGPGTSFYDATYDEGVPI